MGMCKSKQALTAAVAACLRGARQVAESLITTALRRHTTDNTSVVVVDLKGEAYWREQGSKKGGGAPALGKMFGGLFGKGR